MSNSPPQFPAGSFVANNEYSDSLKQELMQTLADAPQKLREATANLTDDQLNERYKNWTIRQIVHHIADSHVNSYIRFKWALTEDNPTIKAYEEGDWVTLADCQHGEIEPALFLMDGLHQKWLQLLRTMTEEQFRRTFVHPQSGETVALWEALNYYPWHARHHTGQIQWLRAEKGW